MHRGFLKNLPTEIFVTFAILYLLFFQSFYEKKKFSNVYLLNFSKVPYPAPRFASRYEAVCMRQSVLKYTDRHSFNLIG